MIYICAGLFAEGKTDYHFLLGLLDQLLPEIASTLFGSISEVAPSIGIDAPSTTKIARRDQRIASAIDGSWRECTLFVVHSDGGGDPVHARAMQVEPGLGIARVQHPDLAAAACVPVREIEAWMLADADAFGRIFETRHVPVLPGDPEKVPDPKRALKDLLRSLGSGADDYYGLLGREVRPSALRRLPAFVRFEAELQSAVRLVGGQRA